MNHCTAACAALLAAALLSGCNQGERPLVYVSETDFGLTVNVAAEGTQKISFGFDREIFALVPRFKDGAGNEEAMSLVSVSNVDAVGFEELEFNHYIATGVAARNAARDEQGLRQMREAVFGKAGQ